MHFIFDANLPPKLAEALFILDKGDKGSKVQGIEHADILLKTGATDEEIIREASKRNSIIISQDDDFKRIKSNAKLLKEMGVGFIMFKPPKRGARYWEMVEAFVKGWPNIKAKLDSKTPPFILQMNIKAELSEIPLL
ncbi:MAG: DUF5615 family PIN-like protein [Flavobacteriales bacterium]|jgi:hypothetical protein